MKLPLEDQRAEDLDLLEALVNAGHVGEPDEVEPEPADLVDGAPRFGSAPVEETPDGLRQTEAIAFADMQDRLQRGQQTLTDKQRGWAERRANDLGLSWGDASRRNRGVPVGAPVALLVDSMAKPLRPPGRRSA